MADQVVIKTEPVEEGLIETTEDRTEVTIKEEFDECDVIEREHSNIEIKSEHFSCINCGVTVQSENALCDTCRQEQDCAFEAYPCITEMLKSSPDYFMKFSGLTTVQSFMELFNYLEDDLPEINGCHKSNQLLSVLIKLHFNNNWWYIDKHRVPFVYVKTLNVINKKLEFLGTKALEVDNVPPFLRSAFQEDIDKVVVLDVITVKVNVNERSRNKKFFKFLIAYTVTGKAFFVSHSFSLGTTFKSIIRNSEIFKSFSIKGVWVVYKQDDDFVKCNVKDFGVNYVKIADYAQSHFYEICSRIKNQYQILKDPFPEYSLLETDGMSFLLKTVFACCCLLNYKLYI